MASSSTYGGCDRIEEEERLGKEKSLREERHRCRFPKLELEQHREETATNRSAWHDAENGEKLRDKDVNLRYSEAKLQISEETIRRQHREDLERRRKAVARNSEQGDGKCSTKDEWEQLRQNRTTGRSKSEPNHAIWNTYSPLPDPESGGWRSWTDILKLSGRGLTTLERAEPEQNSVQSEKWCNDVFYPPEESASPGDRPEIITRLTEEALANKYPVEDRSDEMYSDTNPDDQVEGNSMIVQVHGERYIKLSAYTLLHEHHQNKMQELFEDIAVSKKKVEKLEDKMKRLKMQHAAIKFHQSAQARSQTGQDPSSCEYPDSKEENMSRDKHSISRSSSLLSTW